MNFKKFCAKMTIYNTCLCVYTYVCVYERVCVCVKPETGIDRGISIKRETVIQRSISCCTVVHSPAKASPGSKARYLFIFLKIYFIYLKGKGDKDLACTNLLPK